jgi:hypothetical protein
MSYEEEDTCMSYREEDLLLAVQISTVVLGFSLVV